MDRKRRRVSSPPVRSHRQPPSVRELEPKAAARTLVHQLDVLVPDVSSYQPLEVTGGGVLDVDRAVAGHRCGEETLVGLLIAGDELIADEIEAELRAPPVQTHLRLARNVDGVRIELHPIFGSARRVAGAHYRDESHGHKKILHSHFLPFQDALLRLFTTLISL